VFASARDGGVRSYLRKGGEEGREVRAAGTFSWIGIRRIYGMLGCWMRVREAVIASSESREAGTNSRSLP
jgi:hypothetical protein